MANEKRFETQAETNSIWKLKGNAIDKTTKNCSFQHHTVVAEYQSVV